MDESIENEPEFTQEIIQETFSNFSIDEHIEQKFNVIQDFIETAKIEFKAQQQSRKDYLRWLDQD